MQRKKRKKLHAYPHKNGKWAIWGEGRKRPLKVFKSWGEATGMGYLMAAERNAHLVVHGIGWSKHDQHGDFFEQIEKRVAQYRAEGV